MITDLLNKTQMLSKLHCGIGFSGRQKWNVSGTRARAGQQKTSFPSAGRLFYTSRNMTEVGRTSPLAIWGSESLDDAKECGKCRVGSRLQTAASVLFSIKDVICV